MHTFNLVEPSILVFAEEGKRTGVNYSDVEMGA